MSRHFTTDQQTLDDLDIFGRRGGTSIHALFDRTTTTQGSRLLEEMLRYPLSDAGDINRRSCIIQYMAAKKMTFPFQHELFDIVEQYLANTDERSRLSAREQGLGHRLTSLVSEDNEYKTIYKGVVSLVQILRAVRQLVNEFEAGTAWEPERESISRLLSVEDWGALWQGEGGQEAFQRQASRRLSYQQVVEYDNLLRFRHRETVRKVLQHLYYLDVVVAIAKVAVDRGFVFPKALPADSLSMRLVDVRHPGIPSAVGNSITMTGEDNVLFLTGANMAGKSTFMKTLGISLFLAHAGFPVAAASMEFTVMDGIFTTINLPDNLGMGASHFYAEVLRVKKVAKALSQGRRLLVIFDEMFRGTNVKDAYEATVAITRAFARKRNSAFVISTHIIEAGAVLQEHSNIHFVYLPTEMKGQQPVYTYRLTDGITADRHGMIIIRNEGILDMLRAETTNNPRPLENGRSSDDSRLLDDARSSDHARPLENGPGARSGNHSRAFVADQQTLDDLNLTGKYRPDSVFNLFNRCRSRGGEALLESMFRHPLTDAALINQRVELLQYFRWKHILFPFTGELLGRVKEYLDQGSRRQKVAVMADLLRLRIMEMVVKDERFRVIVVGVQAMREMLRILESMVMLLDEDGPFGDRVLELRELLGLPGIRDVMGAGPVARHHYILQVECREALEQAINIISELDVYIAVSDVARDRGFCQEVARTGRGLTGMAERLSEGVLSGAGDGVLRVTGLYHPSLSAEKAVSNDLNFGGDHNTLFLTGANMSGKSTLMKAFGIAVYLAHMGFPLPAASMEFSVMDGLYSSINVPDNLALGYSHFYAEVIRVKTVAADVGAGARLVVIFDELFKGTNVQDAYEATKAVTHAFAGFEKCFFIVSTHIIEAGEALCQEQVGIQFARLPTVLRNGEPRYTHKLEEGITDDRHGMTIIRNEGILEMLE